MHGPRSKETAHGSCAGYYFLLYSVRTAVAIVLIFNYGPEWPMAGSHDRAGPNYSFLSSTRAVLKAHLHWRFDFV